jgi:tetratricopeptide (TPR) repeat protein
MCLQRYQEVLQSYDLALKLNPEDEISFNEKGTKLCDLQRYEEALQAHETAIQLQPKFALYYHHKGETLGHLQRFEEAIEAYDAAIQVNQTFSISHIFARESRYTIYVGLKRPLKNTTGTSKYLCLQTQGTYTILYGKISRSD